MFSFIVHFTCRTRHLTRSKDHLNRSMRRNYLCEVKTAVISLLNCHFELLSFVILVLWRLPLASRRTQKLSYILYIKLLCTFSISVDVLVFFVDFFVYPSSGTVRGQYGPKSKNIVRELAVISPKKSLLALDFNHIRLHASPSAKRDEY